MAALRHALTIGFANRLARRLDRHNGYKTLGPHAVLAQLHPSTAEIQPDDDGLLPEWVLYHELIATARTFLRWVASICPSLQLCFKAEASRRRRSGRMLCWRSCTSTARIHEIFSRVGAV